MHSPLNTVLTLRNALLQQVEELTPGQLNKIPDGFANNIIWHLGHVIAAQQGICYKRSGEPITIDDNFFERYKPGTKPGAEIAESEIEQIKKLLITTIHQLEADVQAGKFTDYVSFTTRYGVPIDNITAAISFLPFHEGYHLGFIQALKKLV